MFYEAHGHNEEIYAVKPMLEHMLAGVQYALGDLKADDSPSVKAGTNSPAASIREGGTALPSRFCPLLPNVRAAPHSRIQHLKESRSCPGITRGPGAHPSSPACGSR